MIRIIFTIFTIVSFNLYSQTPNLEWAVQIGGPSIQGSRGQSITFDSLTNSIVSVGYFSGTHDFDPGINTSNFTAVGTLDAYIQKLDLNGNFIWAKQAGGIEQIYPQSVKTDNFGNIYVTGSFRATVDFDPGPNIYNLSSNGQIDVFILKLDPAGNFIWAKQIGGTLYDTSYDLFLDPNNNIYVVGSFMSSADFNPSSAVNTHISNGLRDAFLIKLDQNGNYVWSNSYGSTGNDEAYALTIESNILYVSGSFSNTVDFDAGPGVYNLTSLGVLDGFLLKIDLNNNFTWVKQIQGTGDIMPGSIQYGKGNIYMGGLFGQTVDFDPGSSTFFITAPSMSGFIEKIDTSGNFIWAKLVVDSGNVQELNLDRHGNVFITGFYEGTKDFDPGPAVYTMTTNGWDDNFIVKLDSVGNFAWAISHGGLMGEHSISIVIDKYNDIYTTGSFSGNQPVDFDPDSSTFYLTPLNSIGSIFIQKLSECSKVQSFNINICDGDSLLIGNNYQTNQGVYYDTLKTTLGCDSILEINLVVLNIDSFSSTIAICRGDSLYAGGSYQLSPGVYYDTLQSSLGCDSVIETVLIFDTIYSTQTVSICEGDSLLFGDNYFFTGGNYHDTLRTKLGCDSVLELVLIIDINECIQSDILVPNVITPNGDGLNDGFRIKGDNLKSYNCKIYNRWGQKIYEMSLRGQIWDGRTNAGEEVPEGTYYYIIEYEIEDEKIAKGYFTLLR